MREVVSPPFMTIMVKGVTKLMTHSKHVNVVVKPIMGYSDHTVTARFHGILRPGVGKINVCLRNHSTQQITLPKWTAVGDIAAANAIPSLLAPKPTKGDSVRDEATILQGQSKGQRECLEKNWSNRVTDWSLDDWKEVWALIVENLHKPCRMLIRVKHPWLSIALGWWIAPHLRSITGIFHQICMRKCENSQKRC